MADRPILFSAPMVQALRAGRKTQTRRAFRDQPPTGARVGFVPGRSTTPYGVPGDRLWVREAWRSGKLTDRFPPREMLPHVVWYEADGPAPEATNGKLRPGMFMPRWASRITLEITEVRVERLQSISETDAIAEGCTNSLHLPGGRFANENFAHLWWTINGDGSWEANPWVWAVSFRVLP